MKLNPGLPCKKTVLNEKKLHFGRKIDLNLRKKLGNWYISSKALYSAETWAVRKADKEYFQSFKCGAAEGWKISEL